MKCTEITSAYLFYKKANLAAIGGFLAGMGKSLGGHIALTGWEKASGLVQAGLIFTPPVVAAAAALAYSKMTSPSDSAKDLQNQLVSEESDRALADLKRNQAMAEFKKAEKDKKMKDQQRSLHL